MRTRIKICGITRIKDALCAVEEGADALGFVFYPKSPRYVAPQRVGEIIAGLPPFVTCVGLFVNASREEVADTLAQAPLHLLQFHGDETPEACESHARRYLRAARVKPGMDLVQYGLDFSSAQAILLDAFVEGYGGGGKTFDWSLIPAGMSRPLVLSGGLDADNVGEGIRRIRPAAVDVSSGVEAAKGIKDPAKIRAFCAAVRAADADRQNL